jgi:TRAP-type uncharacterized transport system fused permease subunit
MEHNSHMTRERALWEAVATVAIPSIVVWSVLLYVIRDNATADEWPLYAIFMALPLPLIFPIYKRYLRGPSARVEKPRTLFIAAAAFAVLGLANIIPTLIHHRDNSDLAFHLVIGFAWLLFGGEKFRRAVKAKGNESAELA